MSHSQRAARLAFAACVLVATRTAFPQYVEQEVSTEVDGTKLAGRLYLPPSGPARAVAVFIHGGPAAHPADTGAGTRRMWQAFAAELAKAGVASLAYDDRGVGGSGGSKESLSAVERCRDVAAWAAAARARPDVGAVPVLLIGGSMGAADAARLASGRGGLAVEGLAGAALLAGPSVDYMDWAVDQEFAKVRPAVSGVPDDQLRAAIRSVFVRVALDPDTPHSAGRSEAARRVARVAAGPWADNRELVERLTRIYARGGSPEFRSGVLTDPADLVRRSCDAGLPVLVVVGARDDNTLCARPDLLEAAVRGSPRGQFVTLDIDHYLMDPGADRWQPASPALLGVVRKWAEETLAAPPATRPSNADPGKPATSGPSPGR